MTNPSFGIQFPYDTHSAVYFGFGYMYQYIHETRNVLYDLDLSVKGATLKLGLSF